MAHEIMCKGEVGIRQISDVKSKIIAALSTTSSIVIDVSADAKPDLSFVQAVEAARIQARLDGKTISLAAPAEGALLDVLTRGGFLAPERAEDAAFWLHEGSAR